MSAGDPTAGEVSRLRVVVMGAAGRDFHTFNMLCRDDPGVDVVAFTAAQIPGIAGRRYPADLAGPLYPDGIAIVDEGGLADLCRARAVDRVVFAYSDVSHEAVMHLASTALAAGADFVLPGPRRTMLRASVPVVAVCAVRTGCGKSQVSRFLAARFREEGRRVAVIRHPMPYGDLARQAVQRFASLEDIAAADCTVEEREEYEPHVEAGNVVFAGVDYARILAAAEAEADIVIWDGGNNDLPFVAPDAMVVLVDPLRPGHGTTHHPGETALRMADVILVAKTNAAEPETVATVAAAARQINPEARLVEGASTVTLEDPEAVRGRPVIVIEDGPTLTHGGMHHGAGHAAAESVGARIVDPRASAVGSVAEAYERYPRLGPVVPALGYGPEQLADLERTVAGSEAEAVLVATPCDLARLIRLGKPAVRVRYAYADTGPPTVAEAVAAVLAGKGAA